MALLKFIRHNGLTLYSSFSNGFINVSLFDFQPCTWNGKLTFGGLLLRRVLHRESLKIELFPGISLLNLHGSYGEWLLILECALVI